MMLENYIDQDKTAIMDHSVFRGLCAPDPAALAAEFMRPRYTLLAFPNAGHVVFSLDRDTFQFHLVNFTAWGELKKITEAFIETLALPFCRRNGIAFIQANVERRGMARKLERLGFVNLKGSNVYRRAVHVP